MREGASKGISINGTRDSVLYHRYEARGGETEGVTDHDAAMVRRR